MTDRGPGLLRPQDRRMEGGWAARGRERRPLHRAVLAALALALAALLFVATPGAAQVQLGAFTGAYDRGAGGHPHVFLAVGGRVGLDVAGPISVEAEALHVPARSNGTSVDLFAYRANLLLEFLTGDVRPFALTGIGFSEWRTWVCGGASCASPPGPGRKFRYDRGAGYTAGVGSRFRASDLLWFRVDGRFEDSAFSAPSGSGWLVTLGVEVRP